MGGFPLFFAKHPSICENFLFQKIATQVFFANSNGHMIFEFLGPLSRFQIFTQKNWAGVQHQDSDSKKLIYQAQTKNDVPPFRTSNSVFLRRPQKKTPWESCWKIETFSEKFLTKIKDFRVKGNIFNMKKRFNGCFCPNVGRFKWHDLEYNLSHGVFIYLPMTSMVLRFRKNYSHRRKSSAQVQNSCHEVFHGTGIFAYINQWLTVFFCFVANLGQYSIKTIFSNVFFLSPTNPGSDGSWF